MTVEELKQLMKQYKETAKLGLVTDKALDIQSKLMHEGLQIYLDRDGDCCVYEPDEFASVIAPDTNIAEIPMVSEGFELKVPVPTVENPYDIFGIQYEQN